MGKTVFVFVCVAILQIASALECYSCRGSNCESDTKTWDKIQCGAGGAKPFGGYEFACMKLNYKDRVSQRAMVQRKCVQAEVRNKEIHFNCPTTDGDPVSCPVCQSDLCNSAPAVNLSFFALCSLAASAVLLQKFF